MKPTKTFSYSKALKFGFSAFIDNFSTFFMIWLCSMPLFMVTGTSYFSPRIVLSLPELLTHYPVASPIFWIGLPIIIFVTLFLVLGPYITSYFYAHQLLRFSMAIYNKKPLRWTAFFSCDIKTFFQFITAQLLWTMKSFLGFLLFIIPGFYFHVKYLFAGYSLIDKTSKTVTDDTHKIATLTDGVKWRLLGLTLLLVFLIPLGALSLGIFVPVLWLTYVHVYKQLEAYSHKDAETHFDADTSIDTKNTP